MEDSSGVAPAVFLPGRRTSPTRGEPRAWARTGMILGLAGALAASRALGAMVFGITAHDPVTFGSMVVGMLSVAMLACYLPAPRASRLDPMVVLRGE